MKFKQKSKTARRNGAKAAGAKSPQGIQTSSLNALRHGLFSKTLVLANESQARFDELLQMYLARFEPRDGVETNLVYEMVSAKWRQQRIWMVQTATLDLEMANQQLTIDQHESKAAPLDITEPERTAMAFTVIANNEKALELMLRYETSFSRMHDRAMKALFRLREESNLRNDPKPEENADSLEPLTQEVIPPECPESEPPAASSVPDVPRGPQGSPNITGPVTEVPILI
ncbi:MAG: hypothetical protein ABJF23_25450 [Bryobacteraceae bacterium]